MTKRKSRDKWKKWRVGAYSTLGLALLFQMIKSSPDFALAHQKALSSSPGNSAANNQNDDQVFNDWQSQSSGNGYSDGGGYSYDDQSSSNGNGGNGYYSDPGFSTNQGFGGGFHSRTMRS